MHGWAELFIYGIESFFINNCCKRKGHPVEVAFSNYDIRCYSSS